MLPIIKLCFEILYTRSEKGRQRLNGKFKKGTLKNNLPFGQNSNELLKLMIIPILYKEEVLIFNLQYLLYSAQIFITIFVNIVIFPSNQVLSLNVKWFFALSDYYVIIILCTK